MVSQILRRAVNSPRTLSAIITPNSTRSYRSSFGGFPTNLQWRQLHRIINPSSNVTSLLSYGHHRPTFYNAQNQYLLVAGSQIRTISFISVSRFVLHALRIPTAGVTVGVGGLAYANYKLNGKKFYIL
jgi:hypothetical protein